jgi:outer membrane lipoprotein
MNRSAILSAALCLLAALLSGACATPFEAGQADTTLTPLQAAAEIDAARQRNVAWGGVIVATRNLRDSTEIEVLAYPLDRQNRPDASAKPTGRFIGIQPGYLETADYAAGRQITLVGTVTATRAGVVGEARYVYPLVSISRLHLWPKEPPASNEPRFHFGIGVGVTR